MDITEVILHQHDEQRRMFATLEEYPRDDLEGLAAVWQRLEILLETHAEAEERYYYPELLKLGTGAADAPSAEDEVHDAVKDHNKIRAAIRKVSDSETGSDDWWHSVEEANVQNSDHMAEEERQDLADFRQRASLELRHEIAVAFLRYESLKAATGVPPEDKDPKAYVMDKRPHGTTKREQAAAADAEKATKPGEPVRQASAKKTSKTASKAAGKG